MDYSQDKTVGELIAIQDDNSDVTLEDIRAILAEEMTIEDIYFRRRMKELQAEHEAYCQKMEAEAEALKPRYERLHTGSLLRKFRQQRTLNIRIGDTLNPHVMAMRKVLATREHFPAKNKREGKAARRAAAQQHHGGKKNRTGRR